MLSKIDRGSDWDGLCTKHTIPRPCMGRGSVDRVQHSLVFGPTKIWGN